MDEQTPEQREYGWAQTPAEPAAEAPSAWTAIPTETEPDPEQTPARPAWAPAVWNPAPAVGEPVEPEAAPAEPPAAEEAEDAPPPSFLKKEISFRCKPWADGESHAPKGERAEAAAKAFLTKEISFRRKPKAGTQEPKAEQQEPEAAERTSFLKKELSFRRKPKAEQPRVESPKPEPAEKTSFLKKDISLRRKPKPGPKAEAAPTEKTPLLKRQISLGRTPKPKAAPSATAPAAKPSFLKKELSLKRKPKAAKPARTPRRARTKQGSVAPKKLVGLKIGASQLAAARVVNGGSPQVAQVARASLAPGIVVGGEVRDTDRLAEALKEFFAKNKLPKRGVRLGIASNRIGVRVFELEGIEDPRQLTNAIRFRAQEALPIPLDEAVLDYQVLEERVDEDGRTVRRILLVVAYRELIERYVAACRKAGIQLAGIDLEAFALMRAVSAPAGADGAAPAAAVVAVSIGSDRSTFAVSDGRTSEFTRVLDWGGASLDVAVARALDLAPSDAEPIKRALGLEHGETPEGVTAEQSEKAREALRREVQTFARELVSSLQFYQNQPGSLSIAEIVVTGGTAHLSGLAEQLQKLIGVRVRVADPLEHVRTAKRLKGSEQLGSLTIAIGLGIESPLRAVNLLPKDAGAGARGTPKPVPLVAVVGGALVVVAVGALYLTGSGTLASRQEELAAKQAELAALPRPVAPQPQPVQPGSSLAGERGPRVAAVSAALQQRVTWDRLLRRFSLVLPEDVWLQSMSLRSPSAAEAAAPADAAAAPETGAAAPTDVMITGRTYSHAGVARLLARMNAVPDLADVQLQTSRRVQGTGPEVVEFTIVAAARTEGEAR